MIGILLVKEYMVFIDVCWDYLKFAFYLDVLLVGFGGFFFLKLELDGVEIDL